MPQAEYKITDGPTKPDLQWAVAYPEKQLHIHFETDDLPIDVHLDQMEELSDGTTFVLSGHIVSAKHTAQPFRAVYSIGDRSGDFAVLDPVDS